MGELGPSVFDSKYSTAESVDVYIHLEMLGFFLADGLALWSLNPNSFFYLFQVASFSSPQVSVESTVGSKSFIQ